MICRLARPVGRDLLLDKYFDELAVGDVFAGTRGRTITEADIALFSAVSGDWSPLHNDAAFADKGPFGTRIAHGLLHRVLGCAVEGHVVDHRADHDAAGQKLPDRIAHVAVVTAKPVDPAHYERVPRTEDVKEPATFRPLRQARADAGHAVIGDHTVELESRRFSLGALMVQRLVGSRDASVENRGHGHPPVRWVGVRIILRPLVVVNPNGRLFCPPGGDRRGVP